MQLSPEQLDGLLEEAQIRESMTLDCGSNEDARRIRFQLYNRRRHVSGISVSVKDTTLTITVKEARL